MARHARARTPNDVRVREGDYFDGSRAPESQGQKGSELEATKNPKRGTYSSINSKRARANNPDPFCRQCDKADERRFRPNEWKPHPPSQDREREREREREKERGAGEEPAPEWHRLSTTPAY